MPESWGFREGLMLGKRGFDFVCRGSFEHPLELVPQHLLFQVCTYPINIS